MAIQEGGVVSAEELMERARGLVPMLRERGRQHELERRLSPEAVQAMIDADLFRTLQPARYGGFEYDFALHLELTTEIGRGDAASAWILGVIGDHQWLLGLFPEQAQEDVWGEDRSILLSGSYAPITNAEPVEGGYRLSGTWGFASGCDYAGWHMVGAFLPAAEDGDKPVPGLFLVPREEFRIEDDWYTLGMAGTGSKDVVIDDVFVPAHRAIPFASVIEARGPGAEANTSPLFRMPFASVVTVGLLAPMLGAALGALEAFLDVTRDRMTLGGATRGRSKVAESPWVQSRVSRAAGLLDAAQLLVRRDIVEASDINKTGAPLPIELRLRLRRDYALAAQMCCDALDDLLSASGARGMHLKNHVQRAWRDAHMMSQHVGLLWETNSVPYGQYALGLEPTGQF